MRFFPAFLLLLFFHPVIAQRENVNWHFGCFGGLRFDGGSVEIIPSALQSREGTASVSDAAGNLLFYTDGTAIYNAGNEEVATGLLGHPSSTSSAVVIPVRGAANDYWIFTSDYIDGNDGVNYYRYSAQSERLLEGPVKLFDRNTEKLAALKPCGRQNYWLATLDQLGTYRIYDVGTEVKLASSLNTRNSPYTKRQMISYLKFSEDGTKLASAIPNDAGGGRGGVVDLYNFDPLTGRITNGDNPSVLDFNRGDNNGPIGFPYGLQFSPSGEFLYVTTIVNNFIVNPRGELFQYDLFAADISGSRIRIASASKPNLFYGALQIAPDGKIYMGSEAGNEATSSCACFESRDYLGVIRNPDLKGAAAAGFLEEGLYLGPERRTDRCNNASNGRAKIGLPTFVAASSLPPAINTIADTTLCEAGDLRLLRGNPQPGVSYTVTGGGLSSQDYFLTVRPTQTTTYTIEASSSDCSVSSARVTVTVGLDTTSLRAEVTDVSACEDTPSFGKITLSQTAFLPGSSYDVSYRNPDSTITSLTLEVDTDGAITLDRLMPGIYSAVTISSAAGCSTIFPRDLVVGESRFLAAPRIVAEGGACAGASLTLRAESTGNDTIIWVRPDMMITNSREIFIPSLSATDTGAYIAVRQQNTCSSAPDTLHVELNDLPADLGFDTTVCTSTYPLDLDYPYAELRWTDGAPPGPRTVTESDTYPFSVTTKQGCVTEDSIVLELTTLPESTLPDRLTVAECATIWLDAGLQDVPSVNFTWSGDFNICLSCPVPQVFVDRPGSVFLQLTDLVTGCTRTDSTYLAVMASQDVYVPNAFSPNGDGINDGFTVYPRKKGATIGSLDIYDRWGGHLFHREDFPAGQPALGWLGEVERNSAGVPNSAVYVYVVVLRLSDGNELSLEGMVTSVK